MDMDIKSTHFTSIEQVTERYLNHDASGADIRTAEIPFSEILKDKVQERQNSEAVLKFSKHAAQRLSDRNIDLTKEQLDRLKSSCERDDKSIKNLVAEIVPTYKVSGL